MKKFICLFLTLILTLSLSACLIINNGSEDDNKDDVRGEIVENNDAEENEENDTTVGFAGDTEKPSDNANSGGSEFSMGTAAGGTYRNEFLGISCTLPSTWTFYSDQQILELNNLVGEYMSDAVVEQLKNANIIYDMYAVENSTGNNININLEKTSPETLEQNTLKQILESQVGTIKSTFANMGYTDISTTYQMKSIDGRNFDTLRLVATFQGVKYYATVIAFAHENYIVSINVGAMGADQTDTIIGYFNF